MDKGECLKIITFQLITRRMLLKGGLNSDNTKQECQKQLDDIDKAVKYMEDNLDIGECTTCGESLWYKCEKCNARLCDKDVFFDFNDNNAQVCESHLVENRGKPRKK